MSVPIPNLQKYKIKQLVDELIVNRGILAVNRETQSQDGQGQDELYKLAFRYYKMIMTGKSPLDIDGSFGDINQHQETSSGAHVNRCIGCNQPLSQDSINRRMPVCDDCLKKVKIDYEILKDLFQ
jgi:hypothetical protein